MLVKQAKAIARQWVIDEGSKTADYWGAFYIGDIAGQPDSAPFPATADVDVKLVVDCSAASPGVRRLVAQGVALEVSLIERARVDSAQAILGNYWLAWSFAQPNVVADPSGKLADVQSAVARDFARREWVRRRCDGAKEWWLASLRRFNDQLPLHDKVYDWLYALSVATHMVLVADLRNPTVRRCWAASGDVLRAYGQGKLHEALLGILGSAQMSRDQVEELHSFCTDVYEIAHAMIRTPVFGSQNVSEDVQPISVGGGQELLAEGHHREAVFWIAVLHTWCQKGLFIDAPLDVQDKCAPGYWRLLDRLGITSPQVLRERVDQVKAIVPQVEAAVAQIIAANAAIVD